MRSLSKQVRVRIEKDSLHVSKILTSYLFTF